MSTDSDWQAWGERDPYFGVIAHEQFRRQKLTPEAFDEFFRNGRKELNEILGDCRRYIGEISTRRTLEFGCGVGRMLIPLSEHSELCVGVDISAAMRAEAARNCTKFNRHNVQLVSTIEAAAAGEPGGFTFMHSYIVLQHIDPQRGLRIIAALLACVAKGGCAVLHMTYARNKYRDNLGVQPFGHNLVRRIRYPLSRLSRRLRNRDPQMQMNAYDINRVLFLAQQQGVQSGGFRFTDHTGHLGVILYLKRE
jgi:SAM-dependent methyltransferase